MSAEKNYKKRIEQLPNSISGDGKNWVMRLKQALSELSGSFSNVEDIVDGTKPVEVAHVIGLRLSETHTTDNNGMPQNNIIVEYDTTNVVNFKSAKIWVSVGDTEHYQNVGTTNGVKYVIENAKATKTYYVKVTAVNKTNSESKFETAPSASITIKGSVLIPDTPDQFFLTWNEDGARWEWLHKDNGYVDFYELRLDALAGTYNENLLDRTRNHFSTVSPPVRSGTAYLFVRNIFGTYSQPATHIFNKPMASKPKPPVLESTLDGVYITMDALPEGYKGWHLVINGETFNSYNRKFIYYQFSGTISVKYCFYDDIGEGEYSDSVTEKIKTIIEPSELPTISYDKFDKNVQGAIDAAKGQETINTQLNKDISNLLGNLDSLNLKVDGNTSSITQNDKEIKLIVGNMKTDLNGKIETTASSITQTKNDITLLVANTKKELDGRIDTTASEIKTLNDSIMLVSSKTTELEGKVSKNTSSIQANANSITSVVTGLNGTAENSGFNALTGLASSIVQTKDSITSVVTELNKNPADCSYSAITQLKDGIDLSVKDADLTGDNVISRINISKGGVTIDGKWLHVTGNTVFDKNVIVGGAISSDAISTEHLKTNAVTSAKIATNAITADKIAAGVVTNEKITDGAVTGVKIADGVITATKIVDGAVSSTKIEGGAITTEHIQAGSIIGQHISAGAVTTDKLAAGDIVMSGALAVVGGSVRLDEKGLTCTEKSGEKIVFSKDGMVFISSDGTTYAQVKKMIVGQAKHNEYIRFVHPWTVTPKVLVSPTNIQVMDSQYPSSNMVLVCRAINITQKGFLVECYTKLKAGSSGGFPLNEAIEARINTVGTYEFTTIPDTASHIKIRISIMIRATYFTTGRPGDKVYHKGRARGKIVLLQNDKTLCEYSTLTVVSQQRESVQSFENAVFETNLENTLGLKIVLYAFGERSPYVKATIDSFEADVSQDVIVDTGSANFIVTDSNVGYAIENPPQGGGKNCNYFLR